MRLRAAPLRERGRLAFVFVRTILDFLGAYLSAENPSGWIPELRESEWTSR